VTQTLGLLYLVGALATAGTTFAFAARWRDSRQPAAHPAFISLAAAVLWPVVVVGAAQMGVIALLTRTMRAPDGSPEDYALAR
jgi:hypothetical protein